MSLEKLYKEDFRLAVQQNMGLKRLDLLLNVLCDNFVNRKMSTYIYVFIYILVTNKIIHFLGRNYKENDKDKMI